MDFLGGVQPVKDPALSLQGLQVAAVAWIQLLAQKLRHAVGTPPHPPKKKRRDTESFHHHKDLTSDIF